MSLGYAPVPYLHSRIEDLPHRWQVSHAYFAYLSLGLSCLILPCSGEQRLEGDFSSQHNLCYTSEKLDANTLQRGKMGFIYDGFGQDQIQLVKDVGNETSGAKRAFGNSDTECSNITMR